MADSSRRTKGAPSRIVLALNCAEHAGHFEACSALPVEVRHARFEVPWEEIAARRSGRGGATEDVPDELRAALREAEVVFAFAPPRGLTALAPSLRWVETPATGFDQLNGTGVLESKVIVTTVGGLFAGVVAEHAFALLFALARRLPDFGEAQRVATWRPAPVRELEGTTLAIVGLGNIGRAVARAAKAFGMRVLASRRKPGRAAAGVDRLYPARKLKEMLAAADAVVVSVAGTPQTAGLIGPAEIAAMKRGALLVNVARGNVVDESALTAALLEGQLGGAGLDVFADEPLPPTSPLWRLPNTVITPHVAITTPSRMPRAIGHFVDNLARYCKGQPLKDVVPRR